MKASKQAWSFAVVATLSLGLGPAGATEPVVVGSVSFDPAKWFTKMQMLGVDRVSQIAVAAAEMARADAALYRAKHQGRNRVVGTERMVAPAGPRPPSSP